MIKHSQIPHWASHDDNVKGTSMYPWHINDKMPNTQAVYDRNLTVYFYGSQYVHMVVSSGDPCGTAYE